MGCSNYQPYQEEKHITMQASKKHSFLRRSPLAYVVVPLAFVLVSTALVFIVSHTMLAPYQALLGWFFSTTEVAQPRDLLDLYFNLSYIRYAEKFYALSTPIYNYFNTPGSAVHTALNPVNIVATRATLFAYYKELYEHLGLYEEYKPQIYKYLVAVAEA